MKKKALALAGCIAATVPTTSIANVLPDNLFGLNLGEIRSNSFLNQTFKGVIPFVFTSVENTKNLSVKLAPESVFNEIGAEKLPILNSLNFQITQQDNKPVILISSDLPIQLPFLNFVLEIQGPEGVVYQDYTVLLDPKSKQETSPEADYISVNELDTKPYINTAEKNMSSDELLIANGTLLLASLSSRTQASAALSSSRQNPTYRVKAGDSLSEIAQNQDTNNASLSTMSSLIYQKNPRAFIRGNINKIKTGSVLSLPTASEINGFELARSNSKANSMVMKSKLSKQNSDSKVSSEMDAVVEVASKDPAQQTYRVVKGDSLSKITQKFVNKDVSFTKMMNAIHSNNPDAFVNNSKNKIKAGAELNIPVIAQFVASSKSEMVSEIAPSVENVMKPKAVNVALGESQYLTKKGDSLSSITKKLGHKGIPFPKMLKAIYQQNPDAFIDGSMSQLSVGSIINVPKPDSFAELEYVNKLTNTEMGQLAPSAEKVAESPNLVKRIRELRKELKQSKDNLSDMKERLSDKEILLQQKNIQLESINTAIVESKGMMSPELVAVSAIKITDSMSAKKQSTEQSTKTMNQKPINPVSSKVNMDDSYKPISKAEMAKLKRELLNKKKSSLEQLKEKEQLSQTADSSTIPTTYKTSLDKDDSKYLAASVSEFTSKNSAYLTMSLLLGLLLVRYRRELYSYTYSKINYEEPTYYPMAESDAYDLKEKNINYHDPKMDEDSYTYDNLTSNLSDETVDESDNETINEKSGININPLLVEATEEIFISTPEEKEDIEEIKQIAHCENLVTELFDDLEIDENEQDNSDWNNIEKVCDNYIDKIKNTGIKETEDGAMVDGVTDFNHMMTDLLESLDKVDKSVRKYNIADSDLPEIAKNALNKLPSSHPPV